MLPTSLTKAKLVGRVWRPGIGPSVVIVRNHILYDITEAVISMADFLEDHPSERFTMLTGEPLGTIDDLILPPRRDGLSLNTPLLARSLRFSSPESLRGDLCSKYGRAGYRRTYRR